MSWLTAPILKWVSAGLLFITVLMGLALTAERIHARKLQTRLTACTEGRAADRARYEAAQATAKAKNIEQVRTVEQRQEANSGQAISNLRTDLERIRRELRTPAGTAKGAAGSAGSPQADSPGGASDPSCLHLTPEERLRGAEDEARHAELVNLVKQAQRLLNE